MPARSETPPAGGAVEGPAPDTSWDLSRLRSLYLASVEDEGAIDRGLREVERLRAGLSASAPEHVGATLAAYRGALITLRAKHALWPPNKLRHLRRGLEVLDAGVAAHPEVAEVRYLRLMSCFYLPSVLSRGWSVREDFAALARLLPSARSEVPAEAYRAIVRFVLEEGRLDPAERAELRSAAEAAEAANG